MKTTASKSATAPAGPAREQASPDRFLAAIHPLHGGGVHTLVEGISKLAEQRINKLKAILGLAEKSE
ncbi:hypothetical protein [Sphingomonas sp. Leaf205]|uniref:hypothetical protein n=1 Tax=Sphingomonas sp. Leaf205 TaxID=2876551 RepID=UPI001E36A551|nr:hypothetical protein [Sphingomonas sp. Leaf205]